MTETLKCGHCAIYCTDTGAIYCAGQGRRLSPKKCPKEKNKFDFDVECLRKVDKRK